MCNNERKPHVHAELIKAWADGHEIQYYDSFNSTWVDTPTPDWITGWRYRIKPEQTDLEKYGVEKGDVWKAGDGVYVPIGTVHLGVVRDVYGAFRKETLKMLLFRRGVVDKLG